MKSPTPSPISDQAAGEPVMLLRLLHAYYWKPGNEPGDEEAWAHPLFPVNNGSERSKVPLWEAVEACISTAATTGSAPVAHSDEWQKGYVAGRLDFESKVAVSPAASAPDLVLTIEELDALTKKHFSHMHPMYLEGFRRMMRSAIKSNAEKHIALLAASMGGDRT